MTTLARLATLALHGLLATDAFAADENATCDKTQYDAFHKTPAACLREMSTDRPDQTESPYTVDAGRFQIEIDLVSASFDDDGSTTTRTWNVLPVNAKLGLTSRVDFQLLVDTYVDTRTEDDASGVVADASGFGDVTTRMKINVWGNDGGRTALAVMPFVKWPLPSSDIRNGKVESGVIAPFSVSLGEHWGMSAMTEVDWVVASGDGYDTVWVNSVSFARDLTVNLGMYAELFTVRFPSAPWRGQADVGFTYAIGENAQLDWGCNFGITDSAPDYNPFVGFSARF